MRHSERAGPAISSLSIGKEQRTWFLYVASRRGRGNLVWYSEHGKKVGPTSMENDVSVGREVGVVMGTDAVLVFFSRQVQLNQTKINQKMPAYVLQFKEDIPASHHEQHRSRHSAKRFILLSQWQDVEMDTVKCSVGFREKVAMMVQQLLE